MSIFDFGVGGLFKGAKSFLHPEKGYKKAQKEMEKYFQQLQGLYQPYINQGQAAYGPLSGAMNALLNPVQLQNEWANSYQTSDAARMAAEDAKQHGLNALSAMGLLGSTPGIQAMQGGTARILAEDKERYMDNLMKKYLAGAGVAQNLYGTGASAANAFGSHTMNMGQNAAQLAYNVQNAPGQMFNDLLQAAGALYGGGMRGGSNSASPSSNTWSAYGGGY